MKTLYNIFEENQLKGLIVADIDDTLCKANSEVVRIYKKVGKNEIALTTDEFATDPDAATHKELFDIRDFRDPYKVYKSIVSGTPIIKNLKIIDSYINQGYDFCFLTARAAGEAVKRAVNDFLLYRDTTGQLKPLGSIFKTTLSHAVNDDAKNYPGSTDAEKKANVLIDLCKKYNKVVFIDDDNKNVENAKKLNLPNLTVIKAHKL